MSKISHYNTVHFLRYAHLCLWNVCLLTYRNNRISLKMVYFSRKISISRGNNCRISSINNSKFSGHCCLLLLYKARPKKWNFQICISVPLFNCRITKDHERIKTPFLNFGQFRMKHFSLFYFLFTLKLYEILL